MGSRISAAGFHDRCQIPIHGIEATPLFAAFWRRHGISEVPELSAGSYDRHAAEAALRNYLTTTPAEERFDVLMCENDVLAVGAVDVARSAFGLRIPEDLAVVGYDGIDLTATPAYNITTYEQPLDEMVTVIMDMIRGRRVLESVRPTVI